MSTTKSSSKKSPETLTLKPSEIAASIMTIAKTMVSMFVWGPPGISKSATAKQVANRMGRAFIDVRLSQIDPTDLRGIPYPTADGEGVRWSAPIVLPRNLDVEKVIEIEAVSTKVHFTNLRGANKIYYVTDPKISAKALNKDHTVKITEEGPDSFYVTLFDKSGAEVAGKLQYTVTGDAKAILGLEEFNSAPPSVQAAAYQLVLDRALGEYEVPDGVVIIGMGNRDQDKGVTFKMPTPIMNRFVHLEMRPDFDDWQKWALDSMVNPEVVGYLSAFKNELFDFEPGSAARGFPTPRSWTFVSDILNAEDDMPEMVAMGLFTGAVGDASGLKFLEFRKIAQDLPHAEHILNGSLKKMPKKVDVSLAYALTTTLCYELKERHAKVLRLGAAWQSSADRKRWLQEADNVLEFMMTNFPAEICIMGAKAAISIHRLPFDTMKMKHFDTFAGEYKDLIMA